MAHIVVREPSVHRAGGYVTVSKLELDVVLARVRGAAMTMANAQAATLGGRIARRDK